MVLLALIWIIFCIIIYPFFKSLTVTIRQNSFLIKNKKLEAKGNFYWPFLVLVCKRFFQIIINDLTLFTTNIITYVAYCCRASFFNEAMNEQRRWYWSHFVRCLWLKIMDIYTIGIFIIIIASSCYCQLPKNYYI